MPRSKSTSRLDALAAGLTHYHGSACRVCGHTKRYAKSGNCASCSSARYHSEDHNKPVPSVAATGPIAQAQLKLDRLWRPNLA